MDEKNSDLSGMNTTEAKEYILQHIVSLKLVRKEMEKLEENLSKWNLRTELACSKGETGLALEAKKEAEKIQALRMKLSGDAEELRNMIDRMIQQLPGVTEQKQASPGGTDLETVDPVMLEQELLMASGYLPGDEKKAEIDRTMKKLEADNIVEIELAKLKEKMENKNG
ncbi:MAG: chromosome partitioning protein [Treponema sp.]|jgi:phage shock protein A|nr:chromosome partitioning protein [Treponema sp.]